MRLSLALLLFPCFLAATSPALIVLQNQELKIEQAQPNPQNQQEIASLFKPACDSGRFNTSGSFLFWQASEDELEFAAANTPRFPASPEIPTDLSANLLSLDFSWDPAFKFLLGYHFASPDWDFNARWTCFYSKSSSFARKPLSSTGAGLFPLWIPQQAAIASFPVYSFARGTLFLHFNTLDLELAYAGGVSRSLFLTLHGGLKGIFINQIFHVSYSEGFFDGTNKMIGTKAHLKNLCRGLGPRIGFGSKWMLPKGFSLIGEAAGAFALSEVTTKREDMSIGTIAAAVQMFNSKLHEQFWVWRPLIEAKAGFQWSLCFGKNRMLNLEAAYEVQQYWEQNMMARYADGAILYAVFNARGNLILQGLSLTASLGY